MAAMLGTIVGATIAMFLFSRVVLWLLKSTGDNTRRIILAHLITLSTATVAAAFAAANGAEPDYLKAAAIYAGPTLLWLVFDLVALRRRRAGAATA